jgi:hypothetical protein
MTDEEKIRPSHAQANRWADDADVGCECGHPKFQHNDDGRCRAQRGRCKCRSIEMRRAS